MDDYHHFGMENFDGGMERWDRNGDGELDILEENQRRQFDDMLMGIDDEESENGELDEYEDELEELETDDLDEDELDELDENDFDDLDGDEDDDF